MPKIKTSRDDIIRQEETETTIAMAPNLQMKAIISMLYLYGCRISEALAVKKKDINIDDNYVNITFKILKRKDKSGIPIKHVVPVSRHAPFIDNILAHAHFLDDEDHLFMYQGKQLTRQRFHKQLKKINPDAWAHLFRHARLTKLVEEGANLGQVMIWAGHSDPRASNRYLHRSTKMIRKLAQKVK